jgi:hypothetical protein
MPLSGAWSDNATCSVQNRFEPSRNTQVGQVKVDASLMLLFLSYLTSTVLKDRWASRLSSRGQEALFRLGRFKELKPNWDSYNAEVPATGTVEAARKFVVRMDRKGISPYFVSPGPNGDVLVQYKCDNGHEAEIWFEDDGSTTMLLITPNKTPYEAPLDMEFLLEHLRPEARR